MEEQQNHPMSHEEALDFAECLEHSIDRGQSRQCDKCGASTFKLTETRTDTIYQCFSRHIMFVPKPGQRIPVQGQPPDAA